MDGNGRWAEKIGKSRSFGHEAGARAVREITTAAAELGVKYLTLYAFSTENWKRPKREIDYLMKLFAKFLKNEIDTLMKNNIRFETIGDLSKLNDSLQKLIQKTKNDTADNDGLTQIIAINYGSYNEITRACKRLAQSKDEITEENLRLNLDTKDFPSVDMLIRTGGEHRLSNFMLWQASYAELYFTDTLWPDFNRSEFESIIERYKKTQRKFGGL
jgi:undecaprenyl diphosphate synthase